MDYTLRNKSCELVVTSSFFVAKLNESTWFHVLRRPRRSLSFLRPRLRRERLSSLEDFACTPSAHAQRIGNVNEQVVHVVRTRTYVCEKRTARRSNFVHVSHEVARTMENDGAWFYGPRNFYTEKLWIARVHTIYFLVCASLIPFHTMNDF